MSCSQLITLALCTLSALAAPTPLLRISRADKPLPGRFIVTLKQDQGSSSVSTFSTDDLSTSNITHKWEFMSAFAGEISADDLETLRADSRVADIEEDGIMKALATVAQFVPFPRYHSTPVLDTDIQELIRDNAPWGLSRISSQTPLANQDDKALDFNYSFDSTAGAGSTVYIIGGSKLFAIQCVGSHNRLQILVSSSSIPSSKVVLRLDPPCESSTKIPVAHKNILYLPLSGKFLEVDGNGHGTHCAGTAVSSQLYAAFVQQSFLSAAYVPSRAF